MNFAETIEVIQGLPGRLIEVTVRLPDDGGVYASLAGFSGVVDRVTQSGARTGPEGWFVWLKEDGQAKPAWGHVFIRSDVFEGATTSGSGRSLEEVIEEGDDEGVGTIWEIEIRQLGVVVFIEVYV